MSNDEFFWPMLVLVVALLAPGWLHFICKTLIFSAFH